MAPQMSLLSPFRTPGEDAPRVGNLSATAWLSSCGRKKAPRGRQADGPTVLNFFIWYLLYSNQLINKLRASASVIGSTCFRRLTAHITRRAKFITRLCSTAERRKTWRGPERNQRSRHLFPLRCVAWLAFHHAGRADIASLWGRDRRLLRLVCNNFVFSHGRYNNIRDEKEQLPMSPRRPVRALHEQRRGVPRYALHKKWCTILEKQLISLCTCNFV